jgi:hypothetical protein
MWKKYKKGEKSRKEPEATIMQDRLLSRKEQFRESKLKEGLTGSAVEDIWRRLPMEAKRKWKMEGLSVGEGMRHAMRLGWEPRVENPFGFLSRA